MKTIYLNIGNATTPLNDNSEIIYLDYYEAKDLLEDCNFRINNNIIISSSFNDAKNVIYLSEKFKINAFVGCHHYEPSEDKQFKVTDIHVAFYLLSNARTLSEFNAALNIVMNYFDPLVPSQMSNKAAIEIVSSQSVNEVLDEDKFINIQTQAVISEKFNSAYKLKAKNNYERVNVTANGKTIINISHDDEEYRDLSIAEIVEKLGTLLLSSSQGTKKTTNGTLPTFEYFKNKKLFPILITSSAKLADELSDENNHYKKLITNDEKMEDARCLVSCVNSLVTSKKLIGISEKSSAVLIEEVGQVLNAVVGPLIKDGSLEARLDGFAQLEKLLCKDNLLLVDALLGQEAAEMIVKITGRPIYILEPKKSDMSSDSSYRRIHVSDYESNIALNKEAYSNNKRIIILSDASYNKKRSKLIDIATTITSSVVIDGIQVNNPGADYTIISKSYIESAEGIDFNKDPDEFWERNQCSLLTPFAPEGVSYLYEPDLLSLFSSSSISLERLLAWCNRFRKVKDINYSNNGIKKKEYFTDFESIFHSEVLIGEKNSSIINTRKRLREHSSLKYVIDRISYLNLMNQDYANNFILMSEAIGHEIIYVDSIATDETKDAIKKGKLASKKLREDSYCEKPSQLEFDALMIGVTDSLAIDSQWRIEGYQMAAFYKSEQSKNNSIFMQIIKFDKSGEGREHLNNLHLLLSNRLIDDNLENSKGKPKLVDGRCIYSNQNEILEAIAKCINIDEETSCNEYLQENCDEFLKFIKTTKLSSGILAKTAFKNQFSKVNLDSTKSGTILVKKFMKAYLGLDQQAMEKNGTEVKGKNSLGKSQRKYCISNKSILLMKEYYDMSFPEFYTLPRYRFLKPSVN